MNPVSRIGIIRPWKRLMEAAQGCITVEQVKSVHALFFAHGLIQNTYAISRLLSALLRLPHIFTNLRYASLLFDSIESKNSFVYNTIIRLYSRSSQSHIGVDYFRPMLKEETELVVADNMTFHFVIICCMNAGLVFTGKQIHSWIVKNGVFSRDGHVQTGLIRFYVEAKLMEDARKVFNEITEPDVVKWNVLINGYVKSGLSCDALKVFGEMLNCGGDPDEFCVTTALTACARAGSLALGKWIHEYLKKLKIFEHDVYIGTALVDMYAKCGCLDAAVEVFEKLPKRNRFSWAAIIGGYAIHGKAEKAIQSLERMEVDDRIKPDGVVLLGILAACTHSGLLEEGQALLNNMEARYGILPEHEHYSCVVDLFCRAGRLKEAIELTKRMPMKPLASVWGALLNSCRVHKNVEFAEVAVRKLLELENGNADEEEAALVQLYNIYLGVNRISDACRVRGIIADRGLRKAPGCSLLEVDGRVNTFVSGDPSHPNLSHIHEILELLSADYID